MVSLQGASSLMLVLRIIALAASAVTITLMVTNKFDYGNNILHINPMNFQDFTAFRYVVAVAATSATYGIIQLPFAVSYAVKHERFIPNGFFPNFDFYGDKVISLLLATAIGVGIGVSYEIKRRWEEEEEFYDSTALPYNGNLIIDSLISGVIKFFDKAIIASSVLALSCLCMAIVSVISSINRSRSK